MTDIERAERARRASTQACNAACASSRKVTALANEMADQLDDLGSSGIPIRPLSEDDSLPVHIDESIAVARTTTGERRAK